MFTYYQSPIGLILIEDSEEGICKINFSEETTIPSSSSLDSSPHLDSCIDQLQAYFAGELKCFDIPLNIESQGTSFRRSVWKELYRVNYGQTISYKDLAVKVECPKAYRAVGSANGTNPISIVIPCHRVIQHDGNIGGYGGEVWRKKWLLDHEKKYSSNV